MREPSERLPPYTSAFRTIHLRAAGDNHAAIAFYQRLGFTLDTHVPGLRLNRPED